MGHKIFWKYPENTRKNVPLRTYMFLIIKDGLYLLNLQFVPFENDASPNDL